MHVYTHSKLNTNLQKKCLKNNLPKLINDTPERVKDKINTHSLQGFINYGKNDMIHKYGNICIIQHCYRAYMSAKSITSIIITMEANHKCNTHTRTHAHTHTHARTHAHTHGHTHTDTHTLYI